MKKNNFYSQQNEDKILYEKYLNYQNGFFIELGAMDGITYSNTLFFEQNLNWEGILIEPTNQFNSLIKNRPKCSNFNFAVSEFDGEIDFLGNNALGGIVKTMHDNHRKGWKLDNYGNPYKVKSKPISEIIKEVEINKVDLFSIDVEGGEYEVLKTFNWSIPVFIVLIEMGHDELRNELCRKFLIQKEFVFDMVIGCNEVWVKKK